MELCSRSRSARQCSLRGNGLVSPGIDQFDGDYRLHPWHLWHDHECEGEYGSVRTGLPSMYARCLASSNQTANAESTGIDVAIG